MVFHWSVSVSKSTQVSRTILSILANSNNAIFWMVSTHPLISKCSSSCTDPLEIVPSAPLTIGITVTFIYLCCVVILQILKQKQKSVKIYQNLCIYYACTPWNFHVHIYYERIQDNKNKFRKSKCKMFKNVILIKKKFLYRGLIPGRVIPQTKKNGT